MRIPVTTRQGRWILLVSLFLLCGSLAAAQSGKDSSQEEVRVIAHLPLENMHVNQMFVQQRGNKSYLYLHRPGKDAFAMVDVTKPNKPVLLSRDALKGSSQSRIAEPGGGSALAIAVTPEGAPAQAAPAAPLPTETVRLVDMSDPKSAKSVKTFKGVTAMYPDDNRKLVYLVNGEGLWIISHRMVRPMPLCTSEDAMNPFADCQ